MQVSDNRRNITVGAFIFLGIVVFVLGIFTLGSQRKAFIKSITIDAVFKDVNGLKEGGNVWFSGVKIGTIKKIDFYGSSQVQVIMNIEQEAQKYIHKDALASLSADGLIGNKIIVISAGSLKAPIIQSGDRIRENATLSTEEIMKTFQVNNKNLVDITTDFKTLAANIVAGKGTVGSLLADEQLANSFKAIVQNLKRTTEATNKMAVDLNKFTETLNNKDGLANKMLTDTVIFARLKSSADELQKTAKSASAISDNLTKASEKLNKSDNAAGLLINDKETADQVKQIMKNLEASTGTLDEDLKALQSNFLFRGYFKKKAKEEAKKQ